MNAASLLRLAVARRSAAATTISRRSVSTLVSNHSRTIGGSASLLLLRDSPQHQNQQQNQQHQEQHVRHLSSRKKRTNKNKAFHGSRGSRGHGWFIKYRQGRGGRSLQGEYWDRQRLHWNAVEWNDAVLSLGSQYVYLDVAVEPPQASTSAVAAGSSSIPEEMEANDISVTAEEEATTDESEIEESETTTATSTAAEPITTERLVLQVASTVMPDTCINFIGLCQEAAYKDSIMYRIEKEVGICGGDVLTNTGKTGQCWQSWPYDNASHSKHSRPLLKPHPLRRDLPPPSEEPMALWHIAGTVSMLCPKVNEIDSRFILCGKDAPHLDGIHRAFGRLEPQSLALVQQWQNTVLTSFGKPKSVTLRIVDCGVLENYQPETAIHTATDTETKQAAA